MTPRLRRCAAVSLLLAAVCAAGAQTSHHRFVAERGVVPGTGRAAALLQARQQRAADGSSPMGGGSGFTATWTPVGPVAVTTGTFGAVTGRVTAIAVDPNDASGNTVYLGTTGGGVWKSTNAAGALAAVKFAPLTDTLAVFSQSLGSTVVPSLSMGAVAVQPVSTAVVLAGTGDPNDATDSLYGEGILRSADGGATWTLATASQDGANGTHSLVGLATAGIAWSGASPSRAVAAMSVSRESAVVNATGVAGSVPGLYYTTDAGVTWQMATVYDGAQVVQAPQVLNLGTTGNAATAVVWDARRGSFYAALRGHGYYASADGATWTRLPNQPGAGLTTANCPAITSANCPIFRGALAVQSSTGDLYALTVDGSNNDLGLWQDVCGGTGSACAASAPTFANRIDGGVLEVGNGSAVIVQGDYDLSLSAVPSGTGTLLLAGTVDLYRCVLSAGAASCTWRNTTNAQNGCNTPAGVAASQHAMAAVALAAPLVFAGNDGGLWRSTDGVAETGQACAATDASHFDNLNGGIAAGGSLAEVVGFAQSPSDANTLMAGLGAVGSAATAAASSMAAWPQMSAGEGGWPAIDQTTPANWYAAIGAGVNVKQCTLGAACAATNFSGAATVGEAQVAYDAAETEAPWILDPAQQGSLIAGTCRVWRGSASTGSTWSASNAISAAMGGGATPCVAGTNPLIRSVAAGGPVASSTSPQSSGSEVMYAGMAGALNGGTAALGGHVFLTKAANTATSATAWTDVASGTVTNSSTAFNAGGFDVSSVTVDTHDSTGATVYATVEGFGVAVVYRSTDFGAHWVNVTSNLPSAPANALAVDPNDANTVYVATDVGVYATQAIATCGAASCWGLLGTGLPNAPAVALQAGAALPTGDGRTGMLRVGTYGRGIWQTPLLAALAPTSPGITLTPTALTFGATQVSTVSAAQTMTITSSGSAALTISTLSVTGDFTETDGCAGQTLAVGATCTVSVIFAPSATGARAGTLTVFANVAGGQATATLSGTGTAAPSVVLTPTALVFAATTVNQTAGAQTVSVANTGGSSAAITSVTSTGDFAVSANTCGATLAPQTACAVSVVFTPTAAGARSGTLTVVDGAGTQTATLSGTGNAPATDTLTPASLVFGAVTIQTASAAQTVTLTNAGDNALSGISASTGSTEFAVTNGCGATLAAHASCAMSVVFAPAAVGARSATLTVVDQFRTQTVTLSGTGLAPAGVSLTPSSLAFGSVGVGLSSGLQTVTLTNNGGVTLTVSGVAVSGDFVLASSTCGTALAVNAACALTVVFRPTAAGARAGAITVTDSAPGGTQTVPLTGTGVDFTLAANGPTTATLAASGGTATYGLLLSSVSGVDAMAALSCAGAPAHTTCVVTPSAVSLGGTITVTAVVTTGVAGAAAGGSRDGLPWPAVWVALGLPLVWRRRRRVLPVLALLVLAGCGAGRTVPSAGGGAASTTPTADGTYNLTVSAAASGVTHVVPLTLVVQ